MNKHIRMTAIAVALAAASAGAMAADQGAFFVNGNLGQANYHDRGFNGSNSDTSGAMRLGYDWNADAWSYGFEGGYVDLGKAAGTVYTPGGTAGFNVKTSGWLLGGNLKYRFANNMFVSGRGGWFHSTFNGNIQGMGSQNFSGNGGYFGVGLGYDFNRHFSLGAGYDTYHGRATVFGTKAKESIGVYSAFAEYRF